MDDVKATRFRGAASRFLAWCLTPGGRRLQALLLVAYLGVTAAGVLHHEPFRDEARRWLLARDAPTVGEIWRQAPYEGPVLWPLLVRVLAKAGLPYPSMLWLNWAFAGAAAALLLFLAPLPWPLKLGTLSTYVMLYEYPVPGRYYCFTIFLLFATMAYYERRRELPVLLGAALLLLVNSSVIGALFAAPLVGIVGWELRREGRRGRAWAPVVLGLAGAVLLAAQIVPARGDHESTIALALGAGWHASEIAPSAFMAFFGHCNFLPFEVLGFLGLAFIAVFFAGILRQPRASILFAFCTLALLAIQMHQSASPRHGGFVVLAVALASWMAVIETRERGCAAGARVPEAGANRRLEAVFLFSAVFLCSGAQGTAYATRTDWKEPFSGSRQMARYLTENGLLGTPIAAHPADNAASVLAWLPPGVKFYYPAMNEVRGYAGQDRPVTLQDGQRIEWAVEQAFAKFPQGMRFLLLVGEGGHIPPGRSCKVLRRTWPAMIYDENYWLYECRG